MRERDLKRVMDEDSSMERRVYVPKLVDIYWGCCPVLLMENCVVFVVGFGGARLRRSRFCKSIDICIRW